MLSKRTIIGLLAGIAIITLGSASLILHIGVHTDDFQDVIEVGAPVHYTIPAPNHSPQTMIITLATLLISNFQVQVMDYRFQIRHLTKMN